MITVLGYWVALHGLGQTPAGEKTFQVPSTGCAIGLTTLAGPVLIAYGCLARRARPLVRPHGASDVVSSSDASVPHPRVGLRRSMYWGAFSQLVIHGKSNRMIRLHQQPQMNSFRNECPVMYLRSQHPGQILDTHKGADHLSDETDIWEHEGVSHIKGTIRANAG
jgi:hypothetical protein